MPEDLPVENTEIDTVQHVIVDGGYIDLQALYDSVSQIEAYLAPDEEDVAIQSDQITYYQNVQDLLIFSILTNALMLGVLLISIFSGFWRKHS